MNTSVHTHPETNAIPMSRPQPAPVLRPMVGQRLCAQAASMDSDVSAAARAELPRSSGTMV